MQRGKTRTLGDPVAEFRPITRRDDKAELDTLAARYQALLTDALRLAQRNAERESQLVREILATGTVEGLAKALNAKVAALSYRAEKYKRTWHSLIPWQYLEHTTVEDQAHGILDTIQTNIRMTETNTWPDKPTRRKRTKKRGKG